MVESAPTAKESRIGKVAIPVPSGVQVAIDGSSVHAKGPKGAMTCQLRPEVEVIQQEGGLRVNCVPGQKNARQFQGLTRSLLSNVIKGVHEGYKTSLDLYGVGYRAEVSGQQLVLTLGLSHQVRERIPAGVQARVETIDEAGTKRPRLHLESHDKELLGQVSARVRSHRPPEPYKGKGVRFTGEKIRQKAGKAGGKAGK